MKMLINHINMTDFSLMMMMKNSKKMLVKLAKETAVLPLKLLIIEPNKFFARKL